MSISNVSTSGVGTPGVPSGTPDVAMATSSKLLSGKSLLAEECTHLLGYLTDSSPKPVVISQPPPMDSETLTSSVSETSADSFSIAEIIAALLTMISELNQNSAEVQQTQVTANTMSFTAAQQAGEDIVSSGWASFAGAMTGLAVSVGGLALSAVGSSKANTIAQGEVDKISPNLQIDSEGENAGPTEMEKVKVYNAAFEKAFTNYQIGSQILSGPGAQIASGGVNMAAVYQQKDQQIQQATSSTADKTSQSATQVYNNFSDLFQSVRSSANSMLSQNFSIASRA